MQAATSSRPRPFRRPATPTSRPPTPSCRGSICPAPAIRGSTSRPEQGLGLGQSDSIELAPLSDEEIKTTAPASRPAPSKPKPSLAATPPPAVKKGEKDIFDDTDFEVDVPAFRRRFRRQDGSARSCQRLRPGGQRHRLRGLRHRRGSRRSERIHGHGPLGLRRGRRRGRRRVRFGRLQRDDHGLVNRVVLDSPTAQLRP